MAQTGDDPTYRQALLVWRSTLDGVVVLDDELRLLQGLGAAIWLVLDDGPLTAAAVVERLAEWELEVPVDDVPGALAELADQGLVVP